MDKFAKAVGIAVLALGSLFFFIIVSTLLGGIAGWTVGLIFGDTILAFFSMLGIHGLTMWQLGICIGFIGGFLKTKVTVEEASK